MFRDVSRCLEGSEIDSRGQHLISEIHNNHNVSALDSGSRSFRDTDVSDREDQSSINIGLESVNRNHCRGVGFILKG